MKLKYFALIATSLILLFACDKGINNDDNGVAPVEVINNSPKEPTNPFPGDNNTDQPVSVKLTWSCSDPDSDSLTYDVYFGTEINNLENVSNKLKKAEFAPANLFPNTTYYWTIKATDSKGLFSVSDFWQFKTKSLASEKGTLTYNGYVYKTVVIGSQEWTVENLKTATYNDGTPIAKVSGNSDWAIQKSGAFCEYQHVYGYKFGYLYNGYAVMTGKLAPAIGGWRVPTDDDWRKLATILGGQTKAGTKLKSKVDWEKDAEGFGTDDYEFSALPGGFRSNNDGSFNGIGKFGFWWSSTPALPSSAYYYWRMDYDNSYTWSLPIESENGFSVRLVRDK